MLKPTHALILISFLIGFPISSVAMEIFEGSGEAYTVTEPDQTEKISSLTQKHLADERKSTLDEERYRVSLKNPPGYAIEDRTKEVDLTYVFKNDIIGKDGVIIRKKGDSYNPLDRLVMPDLLVIDGENENHIKWAIEQKEDLYDYMILITSGSFLTVGRLYKLRVYRLTDSLQRRFQITHIPCAVTQDGNKVMVMEYGL